MPAEDEKNQYYEMIHNMKKDGLNYKERRDKLEAKGLRRDIAEMLLAESVKRE